MEVTGVLLQNGWEQKGKFAQCVYIDLLSLSGVLIFGSGPDLCGVPPPLWLRADPGCLCLPESIQCRCAPFAQRSWSTINTEQEGIKSKLCWFCLLLTFYK